MSLTAPHVLDSFGTYKPLNVFDRNRNDLNALNSDYYEEDENQVRFLIGAPGLVPDNAKVSVQDNYLHVSGTRHSKSEDGTTESSEHFEKTISLDQSALDVEHMNAKIFDRTLLVNIPKKGAKSEEKES
mmetsp:Transcript_14553/g.27648  ORF Transcript_14553/g.27648 Transcript_14553/m.27648 type:complete len:129 (-) Transcript_14553:84-470(-)|eukprot:scaffold1001_cov169-Amphora_coffeaeformis.AAC.17